MKDEILQLYADNFGESASHTAWAPGRVNLIGEHTDYNEGFVLPLAVDRGVGFAGAPRTDRKVSLYSPDYGERGEFSLDAPAFNKQKHWINYFQGVVVQLQKRGFQLKGCQAVLKGDLPRGAGLSSSAALEVASAVFLGKVSGFRQEDLELVRTAQAAENEFVGVACGVMDQFASYLGKKDHALLIDCRDLETERVPLPNDLAVVVCDTGVERTLSGSAYNRRREECARAVSLLSKALPGLRSLRDVTSESLRRHQDALPPLILKRARHVVTENERVLQTVQGFRDGDREKVGRLMAESHDSLRDDYEVSCRELDILVEFARNTPGVLGARMTGAGFGGCTVNLMPRGVVDDFAARAREAYGRLTGRQGAVYVFSAADGAKYSNDNLGMRSRSRCDRQSR